MTTPTEAVAGGEERPSAPRTSGQIEAVLGVLAQPGRTFRLLPRDRAYALAFLGPAYFAFVRLVYRTGWEFAGLTLVLAGFAVLFVVPAFAWVMRQVVRVFGKRLSTAKLMNIGGYALVPRLLFAGVATVLGVLLPYGGSRALTLVIVVVGILVVLYSLGLYIYGIAVCPSEDELGVEAR